VTGLLDVRVLEGVRAEMVAAEREIGEGTATDEGLGWRLFGAGMLLASVPDLLFEELEGPAAVWQSMAKEQYLGLRQVLTDRDGVDDPLGYLEGLPTGRMFTAVNLQMMAHGGFTQMEIEQLRETLARAFDAQNEQ